MTPADVAHNLMPRGKRKRNTNKCLTGLIQKLKKAKLESGTPLPRPSPTDRPSRKLVIDSFPGAHTWWNQLKDKREHYIMTSVFDLKRINVPNKTMMDLSVEELLQSVLFFPEVRWWP
uniref:AAA+ ATPase At3g28540-like C-terminal domain-containing protein n=1 Tax=Oryza glumipatula TaxID=40148 RepID=A0A0E0BSL0_9ORYZ